MRIQRHIDARKKWLISFGHAFILLFLSLCWLSTPYTYGDEEKIVKWSSAFRQMINDHRYSEELIFIDISHDKVLITSESGTGHDVVTNRNMLATYFNRVKNSPGKYKLILCDVLLKGVTPYDNILRDSLKGIKKVLFPADPDNTNSEQSLVFPIKKGLANYIDAGSGYFKFKLFQQDSIATLPLAMYEIVSGHSIKKYGGLHFDGPNLCFNTIITDQPVRHFQVFDQQSYVFIRLSKLLQTDQKTFYNEFLKDKMVIIGDFENDLHETIFGSTAGPIILLNIYFALIDGRHIVSTWWLIYMLIGYTLLSKLMLFYRSSYRRRKIKWLGPLIQSSIFLILMSVISYFLFDRHIQVLITVVYINVLHYKLLIGNGPITWEKLKKTYEKVKESKI